MGIDCWRPRPLVPSNRLPKAINDVSEVPGEVVVELKNFRLYLPIGILVPNFIISLANYSATTRYMSRSVSNIS